MSDSNPVSTSRRYPALDSLRGIAAITVVIYHLVIIAPHYSWRLFFRSPLAILTMGPESVLLFFVLSGFVLTLQITGNKLNYWQYLVQRICRIYLPYLVAMSLALLGAHFLGPAPGWLPPFAQEYWGEAGSIADAVLFIGSGTHTIPLDPVIWSLIYEMRISLVFPLVLVLFRYLGTVPMLVGGAIIAIAASYLSHADIQLQAVTDASWLATLHYLFMFVCGAALALHRDALTTLVQSASVRRGLLAVSLALYWGADTIAGHVHLPTTLVHDFTATIAVCGLIICVLAGATFSRALEAPALVYLGRISYSVYLLHVLLLLGISRLLGPYSSYALTAVLTVVLCVPVAHLSYHWVELPTIQLGRWLSRGIAEFKVVAFRPKPTI
jgi:peptidoglycan/LPS O-acetylase OafA/YrhL